MSDAEILLAALGGETSLTLGELASLDPQEQVAAILREAKTAGSLWSEFDAGDLQRYLKLFRATREAVRAYSPEPYAGRVALFRAAERRLDGVDETLGWRQLVRGEFDYHLVPGRHLTMVQSPNVRVLAEQLSKLLDGLPSRAGR